MLFFAILSTVLWCNAGGLLAARYPADLPQCYPADNECLKATITHIFHTYPQGIPGLNIPSMDPLRINSIDISQGAQSPIAINLQLRDQQLFGISKGHVLQADGFLADPRQAHMFVLARVPLVTLRGNYTIAGRVLVLPIQGVGESEITLHNCDISFRYKPEVFVRNGRQYVRAAKFKLEFEVDKFGLHFTNLFNGDRALGDNMNLFLNENSADILGELKPSITLGLEQIFEIILNRIFAKVPYTELFKH